MFGAHELLRQTLPDGSLLLSELALGDARLLLSEETPALGALAPPTLGGSPVLLTVGVDDPDGVAERAVVRGAQVEMPVADDFWGERYGVLRHPSGHCWATARVRATASP